MSQLDINYIKRLMHTFEYVVNRTDTTALKLLIFFLQTCHAMIARKKLDVETKRKHLEQS